MRAIAYRDAAPTYITVTVTIFVNSLATNAGANSCTVAGTVILGQVRSTAITIRALRSERSIAYRDAALTNIAVTVTIRVNRRLADTGANSCSITWAITIAGN